MIPTILKDADGNLCVNDAKQFVKPFSLTPDAPNASLALAAAVAAQASAPMTITQEGPFEGYSLIAQSTRFTAVGDHECTCMITDNGSRKQLMNRECHANTIFGTPNFPMVLPQRMFLHENRSLRIRFQNIFANANAVRSVIHGRRWYPTSAASGYIDEEVRKLLERSQLATPYFLTTEGVIDELTVAAGATSYFLPSDADSYFECFKMAAVAYDTTTNTITGTFDIIFRDAETRRELETGLLSNQLCIGTGLTPFILAESWLIRPKQRVEVQITNTTASGNNIDVYLTFIGRKIYV